MGKEIKLEDVRNNAVGKSLSREELERFQVGIEEERIIKTRDGETRIFFYAPLEKKDSYPVFINLHGGGFVKGHRDQDVVFCKNIAQNSGYVVIDIDYHTAPEKQYPYALNECYDVVKYVTEHPQEFMADTDVLVIAGHSAGANLTVGVEFLALESKEFRPTLLILDYPPLDLVKDPAERRYAYAPDSRIPVEQLRMYNEWYIEKQYRKEITASPVYASPDELEDFPPVVMILAESDSLSEEGVRFTSQLVDAGVTVYAKRVKGSSHGFTVRRTEGFEAAEEMIFTALRKQKGKR